MLLSRCWTLTLTILALVGAREAIGESLSYTITAIPTLGGTQNYAVDINDNGAIVGDSDIAGDTARHAFLYEGGTVTDLTTLGGLESPYAINNNKQIAGTIRATNGNYHAFLYKNGSGTDLGAFGGASSYATGVNDNAQVVGNYYATGSMVPHAFLWKDGIKTDIPTLGGNSCYADGVNSTGQVVGAAEKTDGTFHAFLYNDSDKTMTELPTLGGTRGYAYRINKSGQIVGNSYLAGDAAEHAFIFNGTTMTDIYPQGGQSFADDINDNGLVVGSAWTNAGGTEFAFLYNSNDKTMTDLETLIIDPNKEWSLGEATAINNYGQIIGSGMFQGQETAFLLTPVPEPASFALFGMGAVGLLGAAWRRRKTT